MQWLSNFLHNAKSDSISPIAFFTLLLAALAALIAYNQWRIARLKLHQDGAQHRFVLYGEAIKLLASIASETPLRDDAAYTFAGMCLVARLLFAEGTLNFLFMDFTADLAFDYLCPDEMIRRRAVDRARSYLRHLRPPYSPDEIYPRSKLEIVLDTFIRWDRKRQH